MPILDVVPVDELNSSNHNPVFVGEVKLTELKRVLQSEGIVAEFKGEGVLVCNEKVAVRKVNYHSFIYLYPFSIYSRILMIFFFFYENIRLQQAN